MASQTPNINLIQDTPTSPNHRPVEVFASPDSTAEHNANNAPEVDLNSRSRDAEGLEVDPRGPYPEPTTDEGKQKWWHAAGVGSSEKHLGRDHAGLIPAESATPENTKKSGRICGLRRKMFFVVAAIVAVIVIGAAVGGGVGGALANKKSSPSPTPTEEPIPTLTSGPVTSGTRGMAALPCIEATPTARNAPSATPRNVSNPYLTTGATFDITCRRGVPKSGDTEGRPMKHKTYRRYNFVSCMNLCAEDRDCEGVTYGANLTAMIASGDPGGNCLLHNSTWNPTSMQPYWYVSAVKA